MADDNRSNDNRSSSRGGGRRSGGGNYRSRSRSRYFDRRRKSPPLKMEEVDWKNLKGLRYFLNDDGTIRSSRKTGANTRMQKRAVQAIKRARYMALLPFAAQHVYATGEKLSRDLPDLRALSNFQEEQ